MSGAEIAKGSGSNVLTGVTIKSDPRVLASEIVELNIKSWIRANGPASENDPFVQLCRNMQGMLNEGARFSPTQREAFSQALNQASLRACQKQDLPTFEHAMLLAAFANSCK